MTDYKITEINNNIKLYQPDGGLPFGTDALLLSGFVRRQKKASCVELGSGTGVISLLMLKREKAKSSLCLEIQEEYHRAALLNAVTNGLKGRLIPKHCDVTEYSTEERYDTVVTNPPYFVTDGRQSPDIKRLTARHEIKGGIADFCKAASRLLRYGGLFYAVYRPERLSELICAMRDNRIEPKRMTMVYEDRNHIPCLVLAEGKFGGSPGMFMTPPFFIRENGEYSEEYKYQTENGDFDDRYYIR